MKIKRILTAFLATAIAATAASALSLTASAEGTPADTGHVYLMYTAGLDDDAQWNPGQLAGSVEADITGDGQYTVSVPVTQPSAAIMLLAVQSDLIMDNHEGLNMAVDSITIGGNDITYTGPSEGAFTMDDGIRINILNTWGNTIKDISESVEVLEGDVIEVTFTVSGYGGANTEAETTAETTAAGEDTTTAAGEDTTTKADGDTTTKAGATTTKAAATTTKAAATTTKAAAVTTKTADGTPSTGNAGVAGIIALAGLATGAAAISRKKQ